MDYGTVPWDSDTFGFHVAQISDIELGTGDPLRDFSLFEAWCRETGTRLVSCRLPHDRLRESSFLEGRGFRFIEMVYRQRLEPLQSVSLVEPAVTITQVEARDVDEIASMASTVFSTGRFQLDSELDRGLNAKRYEQWVRTSFVNPRHQVVKAEIGGAIVGFFIVEQGDAGNVYWHLTAVAPAHQGRGIGRALWSAMLSRHRQADILRVETTVSAHNIAVLNLYARLGFRVASAEMTFHCTDIR